MSPGGVDRYRDVQVKIVNGHNPDLVVVDSEDGQTELKRIDLTQYATIDALHALMSTEGFVARNTDGDVVQNKSDKCYAWRDMGECLRNPTFMRTNCALACRNLVDKNARCNEWAASGQCETNPKFMLGDCPVACGWKEEL